MMNPKPEQILEMVANGIIRDTKQAEKAFLISLLKGKPITKKNIIFLAEKGVITPEDFARIYSQFINHIY